MASIRAKPALRPFLPTDSALLAAIFQASIEDLTADDYDDDQRQAWAAVAEDEAAFGARLAGWLTLVATIEGAPAAFGSLHGNDKIEMLYVDPAVAGQGLGSLLCDALEKLSQARGANRLSVDASDTAEGFFRKRGFTAMRRNVVPLQDEWLANTTMQKTFGAPSSPGSPVGTSR